jgi:hypothetical protein
MTVFTGSKYFHVKEVEIFEIAEYPALPNKSHWREREESRDKICFALERARQQFWFGEEGGGRGNCSDSLLLQKPKWTTSPEKTTPQRSTALAGTCI